MMWMFILLHIRATACDVCGSNFAYAGLGLINNNNSNLISLRCQFSRFNSGTHNVENLEDMYSSLELGASYKLTSRLKLQLIIPYHYNIRKQNQQILNIDGVGDLKVMGSGILVDNFEIGNTCSLYVETGLGLSMPTGKYHSSLHERNLPETFNLGRGSTGLLFLPQIGFSWNNLGLMCSFSYYYNLPGRINYILADQILTQFYLSYKYALSMNTLLTPFAGILTEYAAKDRYANGNIVANSGAHAALYSVGLNTQYKSFVTGVIFSVPLTQKYAAGASELSLKLSIQLNYLF